MKITNDTHRPFVEQVASNTREYVQSLLEENQRLNSAINALKSESEQAREESRRFAERYVEIEQQNTNLANLYVASYQLHGTLDRDRVVAAITEIVINLIGSEELAIWELEAGKGLSLIGSFGIAAEDWTKVPLGSGLIGSVAQTGTRFIADSPDSKLTACIPLMLDETVIGVIAIFGLLPQKQGLEQIDYELFDLLASHAASALFCTRLYEAIGAAE
jgi:nitrate/nitrite-specific signal transduction histidine kinase